MNRYRCPHCGKIVEMDSAKQWVRSECIANARTVHLQLVKPVRKPKKVVQK